MTNNYLEKSETANPSVTEGLPMEDLPQKDLSLKEVQSATDKKASKKKSNASKPIECVYSAQDLAKVARMRFGTTPEMVTAALRVAGKQRATIGEAEELIKNFISRRVN